MQYSSMQSSGMRSSKAVPIPPDVQARYAAEGLWDDVALRDGIETWAARTPERVALVDNAGSCSYSELASRIALAVACLRERGIGPGSAVLVLAPLDIASVVSYAAIVRTGAVAVMLDRRVGRADVEHALALPDLRLVVAPEALVEAFRLGAASIPILTPGDLITGSPDRGWTEPDPRAPAAVVFTSGTTSRPKGVLHSLNTLRSGARSMAEAFDLTADDNAFLSTPLASITGLLQTHLMLDRGAGLILEDRFEPGSSLERLRRYGATVIGGAPIIVEQLFRRADAEGLTSLPLRAMALGGTVIPRAVLEIAVERYGILPVRMYGASEIPSATGTLPTDQGAARLRDDGAPARGVEVRVDDDGPGELLVRGPMRLLGYLDADDNRAAFVAGGWFRTGDLGAIQHGRLTVTGRLKDIVARKGMKISLAEIDEVAGALPNIDEAISYGLPDEETGERLVLAVHVRDPHAVTFDDVIGQLRGSGLATWKLPEQIVVWDGPLPRTESGKVQRQAVADDVTERRTLFAPRLRGDRGAG
jgi:acyl-CoA synthetase (AMP-forming)/AMP-acid ligase II